MSGDLWYACEQPERPTDAMVIWHYGDCRGCSVKAHMLQHHNPEDTHVAWVVMMTEVDA